ncbi:hypothetical protein Chor_014697 [Crotalus horridus]
MTKMGMDLSAFKSSLGTTEEIQAVHLLDEMDLDGDRRLSANEILENQDLFLNSEATDYGRQLHDKSFYHEEL